MPQVRDDTAPMPADALARHQARLARCRRCPKMLGRPIIGTAVVSPVMLIGQAPGSREVTLKRPFAWTAGKTLFGWFEQIGLAEALVRQRVYMAAVCRCFPGKNPAGGDRVPSREEIGNCSGWLDAEMRLLRPQLVIPVGQLAIGRFLPKARLDAVIGRRHRIQAAGMTTDAIPLPHPSGASVWHHLEPGRTLLQEALALIRAHPAWEALLPHDVS